MSKFKVSPNLSHFFRIFNNRAFSFSLLVGGIILVLAYFFSIAFLSDSIKMDNIESDKFNRSVVFQNENIVFRNFFLKSFLQDNESEHSFFIDSKKKLAIYSSNIVSAKKIGNDFYELINSKDLSGYLFLSKYWLMEQSLQKYFSQEELRNLLSIKDDKGSRYKLLIEKKELKSELPFSYLFVPWGIIGLILMFYVSVGFGIRDLLEYNNAPNFYKLPRQVFAFLLWITLFFPLFLFFNFLTPIGRFLYSWDFGKVKEYFDKRKKRKAEEKRYDLDVRYGLDLLRESEKIVKDDSAVLSEIKRQIQFLERIQEIRNSRDSNDKVEAAIDYVKSLQELE